MSTRAYITRLLGAALLAMLTATPAFAQAKQLIITSTALSPLHDVLTVAGANFGTGPSVFIAGVELPVISVSEDGSLLTAQVTMPLEPGSYLVHVSRGTGNPQNAAFAVTVGG